ncbi:MAG: NRDE family protein [bacterium]
MRYPSISYEDEGFIICILIGRLEPKGSLPFIAAGNRDEFYDREGKPPILREESEYRYVSPKDSREGGTWIGINEAGVFVGLTNTPSEEEVDDAPSRGTIVRTLLEEGKSTQHARELLEDTFDIDSFNPFSLLIVAPDGLMNYSHNVNGDDGVKEGESGSFVLSNETGFELHEAGGQWDRFPWRHHSEREDPEQLRGRLQGFCKMHESFMERDQVCYHGDEAGTLSSTNIIIDRKDRRLYYDYTGGPPCEVLYQPVDVTPSFEEAVINSWD